MSKVSVFKRFKLVLELFAQVRVPGWQLQRFAKMRGIFVDVETGLVGCDLKQNTLGDRKLDCPAAVTVDHGRYLISRFHKRLAVL